MSEKRWKVSPSDAGARLDVYLAARLGLSRQQSREVLRMECVRVDGRPAREAQKGMFLTAGSTVDVDDAFDEIFEVTANPDLSFATLAEGPDWMAIDKPAGVAVHPLRGDQHETLLNHVCHLCPSIRGVGEGGLRSGVVHRLDVDTSGVQLFALSADGFARIRRGFRQHEVQKVYWALVEGHPPPDGEVELELRVRQHRPARVGVVDTAGGDSRTCFTSWRTLGRGDHHTWLELRPRTGFLHQIRVTLAHLGHPLVGDSVYGARDHESRHMLHARSLSFEEIDVTAPEPADFARVRAATLPSAG